jgi:hypothetical protein
MQIKISKNQLAAAPAYLLQRAGYKYIIDRHTGKESFVRELSRTGYPRLHLYLEENNDNIVLNLHLDQKKPLYRGQTAHSGEYEGSVVEEEIERLKGLLI